ncbi:MAG: VWA domain-containing protein [Bacteroidales bacterium]|nr:VWA domain-containing protein [Bacteroidales bacterium]
MFRFANSNILFLLFIIPLLYAWFTLYRRGQKKRISEFGEPRLISVLMPGFSGAKVLLKFSIIMVAVALLIIALARPQYGSKLREVKQKGIELIIALDVSNSMRATDIAPSRLERSKQAVSSLIGRMADDQVGLIVFAGDAYTQLPITSDYSTAKLFISNVNTEMVSRQGTAIGKAISLGMNSFTQNEKTSKAMVIISDGENHEGDAVEMAKNAAEKGIKIFTIGIGSGEGSLIPDKSGRGFVTDKQGNPVTSRMDPDMLVSIANAGGGKYFSASVTNVGLNDLYNELKKLEKALIQKQTYSEYEDQFTFIVFAALVLLLLDILVLERKNKWFGNFKLFTEL